MVLLHLIKCKLLSIKGKTVPNLTMDLSSAYSVDAVAYDPDGDTQGSTLTVNSPTEDKTFTCRVDLDIQEDPIDTTVELDFCGTFLYF